MAKLLLDENPLVVQPSLAAAIGLNKAIVVQQLHYWLNKTVHSSDGRKWVYNSMVKWHKQFFFWSPKTVERTFTDLVQEGIVIRANYNRSKIDNTYWYSIDYDVLNLKVDEYIETQRSDDDSELVDYPSQDHENVDNEGSAPLSQNDHIEHTNLYIPLSQNDQPGTSSCLIHSVNLGGPIPETTTETTTENISQSVSQESTDRLTDGISSQQNINVPDNKNTKDNAINCISKIIGNCDLKILFDKDMANAITMALQNLYFNKDFAQNKLKLPLEVVRERMQSLCGGMIELAVQNMQKAAAYGTNISSPTNYLQSCIFNAISEYTTYLLSDEYLSRIALDKTQLKMSETTMPIDSDYENHDLELLGG